jgi:hypothetical protein
LRKFDAVRGEGSRCRIVSQRHSLDRIASHEMSSLSSLAASEIGAVIGIACVLRAPMACRMQRGTCGWKWKGTDDLSKGLRGAIESR